LYGELIDYIHQPIGYDYPDFISWMTSHSEWDLAIAPLQSSNFNSFKSDIKWLDYSMLGVAGIYSDVPAYQSTIINSFNGLIVDNSTESWISAIEALSEDGSLRRSIVENSRRQIIASRLVKHSGSEWRAVLEKLV